MLRCSTVLQNVTIEPLSADPHGLRIRMLSSASAPHNRYGHHKHGGTPFSTVRVLDEDYAGKGRFIGLPALDRGLI
ncbi:hypothetical protein ERY430_80430 [Erythrobacter sp. EC-HK427]|nr:hypothetical protein ERY430_80430 [Erythrobacter sp. EC-HK427]